MPQVQTESLNSKTCPLCGGPNGCRIENGIGACWCSSTVLSPSMQARVPAELRNKVCICRACATNAGEPAATPNIE